MCAEVGLEAADERSAVSGVERLGQRGRLHHDGIHLPHPHGAASHDGAQSQVSTHTRTHAIH